MICAVFFRKDSPADQTRFCSVNLGNMRGQIWCDLRAMFFRKDSRADRTRSATISPSQKKKSKLLLSKRGACSSRLLAQEQFGCKWCTKTNWHESGPAWPRKRRSSTNSDKFRQLSHQTRSTHGHSCSILGCLRPPMWGPLEISSRDM